MPTEELVYGAVMGFAGLGLGWASMYLALKMKYREKGQIISLFK